MSYQSPAQLYASILQEGPVNFYYDIFTYRIKEWIEFVRSNAQYRPYEDGPSPISQLNNDSIPVTSSCTRA